MVIDAKFSVSLKLYVFFIVFLLNLSIDILSLDTNIMVY